MEEKKVEFRLITSEGTDWSGNKGERWSRNCFKGAQESSFFSSSFSSSSSSSIPFRHISRNFANVASTRGISDPARDRLAGLR